MQCHKRTTTYSQYTKTSKFWVPRLIIGNLTLDALLFDTTIASLSLLKMNSGFIEKIDLIIMFFRYKAICAEFQI